VIDGFRQGSRQYDQLANMVHSRYFRRIPG
jgi:hypothetical protein